MNNQEVVLYVAMSLDGYIAREDGSVDWLDDVEGDGGDNGYSVFYGQVGSLIMGRATFEVILKLTEEFPYPGKPVYVYTSDTNRRFHDSEQVVFTNEPLKKLVSRLKEQSEGVIWLVGGGILVKGFLESDLVDRIELAIIPKVLGGGIPLFPQGTPAAGFKLETVSQLNQIAMLTYIRQPVIGKE